MSKIKDLIALNPNLKLEVMILDKNQEYFFANKITANHYDNDLNLLKNDYSSLHMTELYFSRDEEIENDCDLKISDIADLIIDNEEIDLMIDMQDDNFNVEDEEIKIFNNKVLLSLYIIETDIEPLDDIPFIELSVNFTNQKDEEEIAEFIYEDFKEEIYRDLNIRTRGDFIASLSEENSCNYTNDYIVQKLKLMSNQNLSNFIEEMNCLGDINIGNR